MPQHYSDPKRESAMLVDPAWEEWARINASRGYVWATWGKRDARPMVLLGSHKTEREAHEYAQREREGLRPRGAWVVIVCHEALADAREGMDDDGE